MRRTALAAALAAVLAFPAPAAAHGLSTVQDLPVPRWLFYYGAAIVLVASFTALGTLWRRPLLSRAAQGRPLARGLAAVLLSCPLRIALRTLAVALFALVWLAAAVGRNAPGANLAPTFVYVVFWLGTPALVVPLGNVWTVLNPWSALADALAWLWRRAGLRWQTLPYPERLGYWPAAVLLLSFAALELAYTDPSSPRVLALAILFYSWATWAGMATFGRRDWLCYGDGFSVYFRFLARLSPFAVAERDGVRRIVVRPPLSGLAVRDARPGALTMVAVMLGTVAFDGFSRTSIWQNRLYSVRTSIGDDTRLADLAATVLNLVALVGFVACVAGVFVMALGIARSTANADASFTAAILWSLVPIAFAYVVAHYFSLLVLAGQQTIALASDPLGRGWDLFGTRDFRPNFGLLAPSTIWYVQVGALVGGHVLGLVVAHDRAIELVTSARAAVRSQYPILALMVLYTVGGMWLLSNG